MFRLMSHSMLRSTCRLAYAAAAVLVLASAPGFAANSQVARGKYLVSVIGCGDCHTPGYFFGKPDQGRYLAGSDVGFAIPKLGVFVPPNLTSDRDTGLGKWTAAQIVTAITTGKRPDGRVLAPVMPWRDFATLTPADASAIAAYLKSLPPVRHAVPGPFGPTEKVNVFVMNVTPAEVYNAAAASPHAQAK